MRVGDKKYEDVLKLLRNSKPVFTDVEAVTEKVMRQIQEEKSKFSLMELIVEFLFGWVYIGWVRKIDDNSSIGGSSLVRFSAGHLS